MRRGTTIENTFTTDVDLSMANVIFITYKQANKTVIEKSIADITVGTSSLSISLTQEDTLSFATDKPIDIQIRARFPSGSAIASNIMRTNAEQILKDGVI